MLFRKTVASVINSFFGLCLVYSWILGYLFFDTATLGRGGNREELGVFLLIFLLIWIIPCILYNCIRYKKVDNKTFWSTLLIPFLVCNIIFALVFLF